ncbi:uncharacterized protein LOC119067628 [Bradysia coprophila]|uniref:uncharacterized protein LOC119067628 n=1 Tax=Bradysia coprophila TaxID=38358 RepID=UPI00187DBC62|nr:uncharacterized protein LOC119067628 [Bradysia coprophila]
MSRSFLNKSLNRSGKKAYASANNNAITENDNRLNNTVCGAPMKAPSIKFQRNNSHPIPKTIWSTSPVRENVKHSSQPKSLRKFLKFIRPNSGKKNHSTYRACAYELDAPALSDDLNASAKAEQNVQSQLYRQNITKRDDVVERAVPNSVLKSSINGIYDVGNDNALNEFVDFVSPVTITDSVQSIGSRPLYQRGKRIDGTKDIISELDELERWSQNISQRILAAAEPTVDMNVNVINCQPREIQPKRSVLRNTIALPVHFSSGYFRKTPVSLRKCCSPDSVSAVLAEEAIERDYDILNNVKHSNIILLMAASYHQKSLVHMTLVLEPVDYTLNYSIHEMDTTMSVGQSISVVQQIASAALYLHECGYIHSNISSHNVLVRENTWCVKLSSFELTTEVDFARTRMELMTEYRHKLSTLNSRCDDARAEDETASMWDQYRQMSKLLPTLKCSPNTQPKHLSKMSRHLSYDTTYRQHLSLHNFQAPELLTTKERFVFPTQKADIYSLCLLLWEMLNNCVPFVVYSQVDMERKIQSNNLSLPFFEREKCQPFMDMFKIGLALTPEKRTIDVQQLITMLENIQFKIQSDKKDQEPHVGRTDTSEDDSHHHHHQNENLHINMVPEEHPINMSLSTSSIFSPNSTEFNQHLHQNEVTSTKTKRRKSTQKFFKKNTFRQLFKDSREAVLSDECESLLSHSQLSKQIEAIASEICLNQSKEDSESKFNSIVAALSSEENEFESKMLEEKPADRGSGNLDSSENNFGENSFLNSPSAWKNEIRLNSGLSTKRLKSANEDIDELLTENHDQSQRLNDSNQLNVSIRIVHNIASPKKSSLVMSKIKFFDSNTKTSCNTPRTSNTKVSNNRRVDDIDVNYSANYPIKDSSFKELVELDDIAPSTLVPNCGTLRMSQREYPLSNVDQPVITSHSKGSHDAAENTKAGASRWPSVRDRILQFEKHSGLTTKPSPPLRVATEFVKSISKYVIGTQSNAVRVTETPTVIRRPVESESIVPGVALDKQIHVFNQMTSARQKQSPEITSNTSQPRRRSAELDDADRPKIVEMIGAYHTTCASRKGLLSPTAEITKDGSCHGQTKYANKDCTGTTKMSADELRASTCDSDADRSFDVTDHSLSSPVTNSQGTPQRRYRVRVQVDQNNHSIEDLYIDDDFDQGLGLGANIELQSDGSDFFNFDFIL